MSDPVDEMRQLLEVRAAGAARVTQKRLPRKHQRRRARTPPVSRTRQGRILDPARLHLPRFRLRPWTRPPSLTSLTPR